MKKSIKLFATVMVCMAMALCVSCKKDDDSSNGGGNGGGGNTGGGTDITGTIAGHAYVDLGLPSGLLWATCNVGASKPEDYGNYYAWGETETKDCNNWNTYQWYNVDLENLTKYCTVDNKTVLDLEDDAAHANWGEGWRMPTIAEMEELRDNCTWTWTTQSGKKGYRVTGSNGASIFLPAAGDCYCYNNYGNQLNYVGSKGFYRSSSLNTDIPDSAYGLSFDSGNVHVASLDRISGRSVRPVCPFQK